MNTYLYSSTVKTKIRIDNHERKLEVKAIVVESGILSSHLEYLIHKTLTKNKSDSWKTQSVQAIRLLLDYSTSNKDVFASPKEMFITFSERIYSGTVDDKGSDSTGLWWTPRSDDSGNKLLQHITQFSDWLFERSGGDSELLNPKRAATRAEAILSRAAYNHRINNSFLVHTYSKEHREQSVYEARNVSRRSNKQPDFDTKKAFREDKIWELLTLGFSRKGVSSSSRPEDRYNLANVLITMLLHFGGLRTSEVFHMYTDDIIPNEGLEQIRIYHPTQGLAPAWYRNKTNQTNASRQTFLFKNYNLRPRWKHPKASYRAGWKNTVANEQGGYFNVFMFGVIGVEKLFFDLFNIYISAQRVSPMPGREHPFLFTNKNGDPLSMESFQDAHKSAVMKIGLSPKLNQGGTPHCHRHAYGTRLMNCGLDRLIIKNCMHHSSIDSQEVYKQKNIREIKKALVEGVKRLEKKNQHIQINMRLRK